MFHLLFETEKLRDRFLFYINGKGIKSVFHYQPLHLSKMGKKFGGKKGDCPITENMAKRLARLPFYTDITMYELDYIINEIKSFTD